MVAHFQIERDSVALRSFNAYERFHVAVVDLHLAEVGILLDLSLGQMRRGNDCAGGAANGKFELFPVQVVGIRDIEPNEERGGILRLNAHHVSDIGREKLVGAAPRELLQQLQGTGAAPGCRTRGLVICGVIGVRIAAVCKPDGQDQAGKQSRDESQPPSGEVLRAQAFHGFGHCGS